MGTNPVLGDRGYKKVFWWVFSFSRQLYNRGIGSAHDENARGAGALAISWITAYRDKKGLVFGGQIVQMC